MTASRCLLDTLEARELAWRFRRLETRLETTLATTGDPPWTEVDFRQPQMMRHQLLVGGLNPSEKY